MAEVKWIKMATELFDNRKIRQIESLPDGDAIIVIWMKLLCLAGNINDSGYVYFTKEIPYTDQMLATQFNRPITTVQLALKTFEQFGMIEVIDNILHISNWEKYQSVDRLLEIREYNRIAKQKSRAKQKLLQNVNDKSMTSQSCHDTDIDKEEDKELERDNNILSDSDEPESPSPKPSKPVKHKYGEYNNVLLTDEELKKLKTEYSDYKERIERLSSYVASTGKKYKSHYATIRNWARKDAEVKPVNRKQYAMQTKADELDEFYKMAAQFGEGD
jgi:predicted phage replisome organizer